MPLLISLISHSNDSLTLCQSLKALTLMATSCEANGDQLLQFNPLQPAVALLAAAALQQVEGLPQQPKIAGMKKSAAELTPTEVVMDVMGLLEVMASGSVKQCQVRCCMLHALYQRY